MFGSGHPLPPYFYIVVIAFFVVFIIGILRNLSEWAENNGKPIETVKAQIVGKRMDIQRSPQFSGTNTMGSATFAIYYATFEFASGIRFEFRLPGREYGMLAEGDQGTLVHRGTRYLGFRRSALPG